MFRKLVSNLPFSPALAEQLGYHTVLLKKERLFRLLGLITTILAIVLNLVILLFPAQPSLAASHNDIIFGGGSKNVLLTALRSGCDSQGRCDLKSIFNLFGITESNLINATTETIYSSNTNNYWVIGRVPRGYGGETSLQLTNGPAVYSRILHTSSVNQAWPAIRVETSQGIRWILLESGNIVTKENTNSRSTTTGITNQKICGSLSDHTAQDFNCPVQSKKARNITQRISDANGTKAQAGDTIEYSLSATNKTKIVSSSFVIQENIQDLLEYADVIDASGAIYTKKPVATLSWQPTDIKPGETITRTILIKIKSQIPYTPAATSDPHSYDLKLVSTFGDTVVVGLPKQPIKLVEQAIGMLPGMKVGINVAINTVFLTMVIYFYFRSKLLVAEFGLVRKQFNQRVN